MKKLILTSIIWILLSAFFVAATESTEVAPTVIIKEEVKCVFDNSNTEQKCYIAGDDYEVECSGVETCIATVYGTQGVNKDITWKSTCGGYAYTTIDGENEYARFDCSSQEVTESEPVEEKGKGFKVASWACYDGVKNKGEIKCKTSEQWQEEARRSCANHCYADGSKCGVNSFSASQECYLDGSESESVTIPSIPDTQSRYTQSQLAEIIGGELTFYYGKTCRYSAMIDPIVSELAKELSLGVNKIVFDVFDPVEVARVGIKATPTLVYSKGDCKKTISGYRTYESLIDLIINGPCEKEMKIEPVYQITKVSEPVTCKFANSKTEQRCYTSINSQSYSCSGIESCNVKISGDSRQKIIWKSTCGGYGYTYMDGMGESITFDCVESGEVRPVEVIEKGFEYASWTCSDGSMHKGAIGCKPYFEWKSEAISSCNRQCNTDKCAVKDFSVSRECYLETTEESEVETTPVTVEPVEETKVPEVIVEEPVEETEVVEAGALVDNPSGVPSSDSEDFLVCKDSCPLSGHCYPYGFRNQGEYCSVSGSFESQLQGDTTCNNNFECKSNVCIDDRCMSSGMIKRIISWFTGLFGG